MLRWMYEQTYEQGLPWDIIERFSWNKIIYSVHTYITESRIYCGIVNDKRKLSQAFMLDIVVCFLIYLKAHSTFILSLKNYIKY